MEAHMLNKALSKISRLEDKYVEILKELIKKRSISGEEGKVGEDSIANLIWEYANEIGVNASFHEVKDAHNIVCEIGEGSRVIVFSAHMDTVSAGNAQMWFANPFEAKDGKVRYIGNSMVEVEVEDKKIRKEIRRQMDRIWQMRAEKEREIIYGRGSYDNKASIAILLLLLDAVKDDDIDGKLYAVFTVREEVDAAGIKKFIKEFKGDIDKYREKYAVVLEGSYSFTPVIAHRGVGWIFIKTFGKRCHASTPHLGKNAISEMCKILNYLEMHKEEFCNELYKHSNDSLLGKPIFNVTSIVGGGIKKVDGSQIERTDMNVIPDFCECSIDIRFGRNLNVETIKGFFSEKLNRISEEFEIIVDEETFYPASGIGNTIEDAMEDELVKAAMGCSGIRHVEIAPGATEGAFLHVAGFKTLVEFGPGGAFSHDVHEYVEKDEIARGGKILVCLLNNE